MIKYWAKIKLSGLLLVGNINYYKKYSDDRDNEFVYITKT
jgi:hypothetical protein